MKNVSWYKYSQYFKGKNNKIRLGCGMSNVD